MFNFLIEKRRQNINNLMIYMGDVAEKNKNKIYNNNH